MPENRRLNWRVILGLWTVVGLILVLQLYVTTERDFTKFSWRGHLYAILSQMYRAWMWAALTPLVFWLRRYIAGHHRQGAVIAGLHLLGALTAFAVGNVVRFWITAGTTGYLKAEDFDLNVVYAYLDWRAIIDFFLYWVVLTAGYIYDLNGQKRQVELREEQLRTQLAQAEFAALKQKVQPHFLFNSLNAISALMREGEAARAVEALALLSTLLRQLMAHAGRPEIELWRELDYAQCYLSVEKVRFEERLLVLFDAEEDCFSALVPTLILQPLVENAVKHGIAQRRSPGRVRVTAQRAGDRLHLEVSNDPAEGGRRVRESDNHGIGLRATRDRLQRAFGDDQQLDCVFNGPDGTKITLELPLRFARAPEPAVSTHG